MQRCAGKCVKALRHVYLQVKKMELVKSKLAAGEFTVSKGEGRSDVWKVFGVVHDSEGNSTGYVQCSKCKVLLKYDSKKTGTSSLSRHIALCGHSATTTTQQQQPMSKFMAQKVPLKTKQAVTEKCVYMCAKDIRPFYVVKGDGFVELAQELINVGATYGRVAASSVLPSPNTVATHCRNLAEEKREEFAKQVKEILNKGGKVGMSTDMWTDDFRKIHYLSITCHYVSEDFELIGKNLTTAMFPVDERKTGDNIRRELVKLLVTKFGFDPLSLKDIVWVTDQGANIVNALSSYRRLDCMDHVLNTVLRHGLDNDALMEVAPDFAETVTAAKALVR